MANPYALFKQLLPSARKWIGVITIIDADTGRITVQVPGSAEDIIVSGGGGSYEVGDYVFIKNGVIEGDAPELATIVNEEVS